MRSVLCLLCCVLLSQGLLVVSHAEDSVDNGATRIATNGNGETIEVRSLNDPDNPYAGQYGAWDLWVWDNYIANFNPGDFPIKREPGQTTYTYGDDLTYTNSNGQPMPEGWGYNSLQVDEQGFVIPEVIRYSGSRVKTTGTGRTLREAVCNKPAGTPYAEKYLLYGAGVKPASMEEDKQKACSLASAAGYPVIPAWLGENLPLKTVFSPNGDIICYGELGLHYKDTGVDKHQLEYYICPETWYRYSPEGELLGQYTRNTDSNGMMADNNWTATYCTDYPERVDQARRELTEAGTPPATTHYYYGYVAMILLDDPNARYAMGNRDMSGAKIPFALDYLGNEIDPDTVLDLPSTRHGMAYRREMLEPIYASQVELGLTDPTAESPFAGRENGPQMADPTPRFPRYRARNRRNTDAIEIMPMDDPANPYLGQYDEWDEWLINQIGQRNPREDAYDQAQFRETQARIEAKLAAGEQLTSWDQSHTPYEPGPDDPWKKIEINIDDNGWIIPTRIYAGMLAESYETPWDVRESSQRPEPTEYRLTSGGIMPDEMLAEYTAVCEVPVDRGLPVVPAWLAESPAHLVVFIPNGDVLSLGPVGRRTPDNARAIYDESYWEDLDRAWYRYDAEGNLVSSYVTNGYNWQPLYYPQWTMLKANAEDTGMEVSTPAGYLVITDPATGVCKAVFDYDGTPVDPNTVINRGEDYCRLLSWDEVLRLPHAEVGEPAEPPVAE